MAKICWEAPRLMARIAEDPQASSRTSDRVEVDLNLEVQQNFLQYHKSIQACIGPHLCFMPAHYATCVASFASSLIGKWYVLDRLKNCPPDWRLNEYKFKTGGHKVSVWYRFASYRFWSARMQDPPLRQGTETLLQWAAKQQTCL